MHKRKKMLQKASRQKRNSFSSARYTLASILVLGLISNVVITNIYYYSFIFSKPLVSQYIITNFYQSSNNSVSSFAHNYVSYYRNPLITQPFSRIYINPRLKNYITKRTLLSATRVISKKVIGGVTPALAPINHPMPNYKPSEGQKRFAHWGVRDPVPKNKEPMDPQAKINNDWQHKEIVCSQCPQTDCTNKVCPQSCEAPVRTESKGHLTHNSQYTDEGKENVKLSDVDFKGQTKAQHAVKYKTPHKTDPSQKVNEKGTEYLNSDPKVLKNFNKSSDLDPKKPNE